MSYLLLKFSFLFYFLNIPLSSQNLRKGEIKNNLKFKNIKKKKKIEISYAEDNIQYLLAVWALPGLGLGLDSLLTQG